MLSVEEARARILAPLQPLGVEVVSLAEASGRVLAAPVRARVTQPAADISAMDGYALRAAEGMAGATLRLVGAAPAGHPFGGQVGAGEAVRLFTGSVVPAGADCVVMQEDVQAGDGTIVLSAAAVPGRHIRRAGQDFAAGDAVLPAGEVLGARGVALAAAANHPWVSVVRRPRVAVLATGDELAWPGEPVTGGSVVGSNSLMLGALLREAGAVVSLLPVARDDRGAIAAAARAVAGFDLLVTTGGASVGEHDLVQAGLIEEGFALDFWKVAMRPGKPMIAGRLRALPVIGLPGNPVSAYVCAVLFVLPAVRLLGGWSQIGPAVDRAVLGAPVRANDSRTDHLRAALSRDPAGRLVATPFERQDSSMLAALARAGALVVRAPGAPALGVGDEVCVIPLT